MKTLVVNTMQDMAQILNLPINNVDMNSCIDNLDDDMTFSNEIGYAIDRELPQNEFNIRTLTQDKIEELKLKSSTADNKIWSNDFYAFR